MTNNLLGPVIQIERLVSDVAQVKADGGTVPDAFTAIATAYQSAAAPQDSAIASIVATVTSGSTEGLADLWRAAAMEHVIAGDPRIRAAISAQIAQPVLRALRGAYAPVAAPNYQLQAKAFNAAVAELSAHVAVVNPDAPADTVVTAPAKTREAWSGALLAAQTLDATAERLWRAAALMGHTSPAARLGMVADATGAHRRRVWDAWEGAGSSRTGRWGALIAAGAQLRAADSGAIVAYKEPAPTYTVQEQHGIGIRNVVKDPADEEYAAAGR